jgi:hypothetical protein
MLTPDLAYYFALFPVGRGVAIILGIVIFLWMLALRTIWRTGFFAPFFTLPGD